MSLIFQEACLKLQGTLNTIATACEEVASLLRTAGRMDEFRHKQILRGIVYPLLTQKGRVDNKKQHHPSEFYSFIDFPWFSLLLQVFAKNFCPSSLPLFSTITVYFLN